MNLTPEQLHILQHSLGVDKYGRGIQYRNHYAVTPDTPTFLILKDMEQQGWMEHHGLIATWGKLHCFTVTDFGKRVMSEQSPKAPKVSRDRQRYLDYLRGEFRESFGEYLRRGWYKRET